MRNYWDFLKFRYQLLTKKGSIKMQRRYAITKNTAAFSGKAVLANYLSSYLFSS